MSRCNGGNILTFLGDQTVELSRTCCCISKRTDFISPRLGAFLSPEAASLSSQIRVFALPCHVFNIVLCTEVFLTVCAGLKRSLLFSALVAFLQSGTHHAHGSVPARYKSSPSKQRKTASTIMDLVSGQILRSSEMLGELIQ